MTQQPAAAGPGDASILLVEDDPGALDAFTRMLNAEGYAVRLAADAPSALAEIERAVPAAVILDLHLPASDGLDVLRRLRTMAGVVCVPVAVVTGNYLLDERVAREVHTLGARLYFKPIWEEELIRIVRNLLPRA